jgi:putative iron-only hydrogenase system regulator
MDSNQNENTRAAVIAIIIKDPDRAGEVNAILHDYSDLIIGRMGIPYRAKEVNIICVAVDAPMDRINALTGALGRLDGVTAKAAVSGR